MHHWRLGIVGIVAVLFIATVCVWSFVYAATPPGVLTVSFIDVGQGDGIFIESPTGTQVLIDGGKGRAVLRGLGALIHPTDRSLDVIIATHPDLDHIGGLPAVFERFEIGMFLESGVHDDGDDAQALARAVEEEGLDPINARRGMRLALGGGAYLEFFFPESDASRFEANTGSVVTRIVYGDTSFMLTGDSPVSIENYLAGMYGTQLKSDVLKVGHHGSKTSSSDMFLAAVSPTHGIVSAGCNNQYGHPHTEVLERFRAHEVAIHSTCDEGTITFVSDGTSVRKL